jgi:CRP/FNR family transcriptional regulator
VGIADQLARIDFFRGIGPAALADLAQICVPKRARKRQILFVEGDEAHSMYLLVQGAVQLYRGTADGREVVIKTIQPGETFAEAILFQHDRFPVSAVTLEASFLLLLPRRQISCLLENSRFRDAFMAMLMQKLRYLSDRIMYLTAQDVEGRLRGFLESSYGRRTSYSLPISKKDLAAAVGTNPETLSRLFARLRREGVLETRGRTLKVGPGFWKGEE